jgi:hypothetical protein
VRLVTIFTERKNHIAISPHFSARKPENRAKASLKTHRQ